MRNQVLIASANVKDSVALSAYSPSAEEAETQGSPELTGLQPSMLEKLQVH